MESILELLDLSELATMVVSFVPKAGAALVVFVAAWVLLKMTQPPIRGALRRADFAETLIRLLVSDLYRFVVLGFGLVMAAGQLGIDIGAALAGIGVVGVAVGFAAQESVANTIAGFLIFWDKPFAIGQYITTEGSYGEVVDITMRTTRIRTPNNTYLVVPNKEIIGNPLVNHSLYGETRVDVSVGIAYKENIGEARRVLLDAAQSVAKVLPDPGPSVVATELGDSSVNLEVRVWVCEAEHELQVRVTVLEACKHALDDAGIEIPFPHLQLFVDNVEERVWSRMASLRAENSRGSEAA